MFYGRNLGMGPTRPTTYEDTELNKQHNYLWSNQHFKIIVNQQGNNNKPI